MGEITTITLKADSRQVKKATDDLSRLAKGAKRLEKASDRLDRSFKKMGASVDRTRKRLNRFGTTTVKLTRKVKRFGLGIAAAFGLAIREAVKFETVMVEISTLLDDTSGMDNLTESVRQLSIQFGASPTATAKALYQIISAGASDASSQMLLLHASNKLAIGGVTDVATAADGLTTILNAYGLAASNATRISDLLFVGMKAGKTTIGEMAASIGDVATVAAQVGVPIGELIAAIAVLTKRGIATTVAMTSLRGVMAAVLKPSSEAAAAAKDMNVQFNIAAIETHGFAGFLDTLAVATGGSAEKMALLVPRVEGLTAVLGLGADDAKEFNEVLVLMAKHAGMTEEAYAKMSKTTGFQLNQLKATGLVLAETFGSNVLPAINMLASVLLKLATPIRRVVDSQVDAAKAAQTMGSALRDMSVDALKAAKAMGELAAIDLETQLARISRKLGGSKWLLTAHLIRQLKDDEEDLTHAQGILGKSLFRINNLLRETTDESKGAAAGMADLGTETKRTSEEISDLNKLLERAANKSNTLWGALSDFNVTQAELNTLLAAGSIDRETFNKWLEIATRKFKDAQLEARGFETVLEEIMVTAERMRDPKSGATAVADALKFELELMGLSNTERRIRIALLEADATRTSVTGMVIIDTIKKIAANDKAIRAINILKYATSDLFVSIVSGSRTAKEAFGDFMNSVRDRILRMIADQLMDRLFGSLFSTVIGAIAGAGGGGGSSGVGPPRAHGGPVSAGTPYLVGEQGPEVIVPRNAGMVIPNNRIGGNNVVVNIDARETNDPARLLALVPLIQATIEQNITLKARRGFL